MSKKDKPLTAEKKYELELLVEADLARAQRQQRILERDRSGYSSGAKFAKQQRQIDILEKEQGNVWTDLFVATCSTKKKGDAKLTSNMIQLLSEYDDFEATVQEKKSYLKEIDAQIVEVNKLVVEGYTKLPSPQDEQDRVMNGQKSVEGLENKLDTVTKCYCSIVTKNRKVRDEINHLLIERITFNKIWYDFIANLTKGKKFMMDIIEQATIAYDVRDEIVTRLNALRSRAHTDLILQTQEMQKLQCQIDYDKQLEEFLSVKGEFRNMMHLEEKKKRKRQLKREKMQENLLNYKTLLAEILEFKGISRMQDFVHSYVQSEDENFAKFNYINVLHHEMEELTGSLVSLYDGIDEQKVLNESRVQQERDNITKLKADLLIATKQADEADKALTVTNNKLSKLYDGVGKLFKISKCSSAPFVDLLGNNTLINDYNILLHLDILENQISELILAVYFKAKTTPRKGKADVSLVDEKKVPFAKNPVQDIVPTNPCPLCVDRELVSDVIDVLQFVQTRREVKSKLEVRLRLPDASERLHNVSACHLPKSREIIQRRYQ